MKKQENKHVKHFVELSMRCLMLKGDLISQSCYEEEIAFHLFHKRFKEMTKSNRLINKLDDRYPFVKIEGKWFVSLPKLYLYLVDARSLLYKTKVETLVKLGDIVLKNMNYIESARELDRKLHPNDHTDYDDYCDKLGKMYRDHMTEQKSLFEALERAWK